MPRRPQIPRRRDPGAGRVHPGLRPLDGHGPADDEIELGYVSGVFGVGGEVRVYLHNPATDTFDDPRRVVLIRPDGARFEATMTIRPGAGKRVLGAIAGLDVREDAATLQDYEIYVARADLPEPDEGFYVTDVLGWPVYVGETRVGQVAGIHATDGGDVLEVARPEADPEFVPMLDVFVLDVDFARERVVLAPGALS